MTVHPSIPDRVITFSELEKHDEDHDRQWIAIDGIVADVTEYKDEHPGGFDLLEVCISIFKLFYQTLFYYLIYNFCEIIESLYPNYLIYNYQIIFLTIIISVMLAKMELQSLKMQDTVKKQNERFIN